MLRVCSTLHWLGCVALLLVARAAPLESQEAPPKDAPPPTAALEAEPVRRKIEISVEDAIRIALSNNLDLQLEEQARASALEEVAIAASIFDPLFATNFSHARFRTPTVDALSGVSGLAPVPVVLVNPYISQQYDFGFNGLLPPGTTYSLEAIDRRDDTPDSGFFGFNPRNQTAIRAEIVQPILKGFGTSANVADLLKAETSRRIADHRLYRLLQTTVATVENSYWNFAFAEADLRVKEEALVEAQTLLDINRQKLAVGKGKEIDVIGDEANIETQKSGIIESRVALRNAQDTLLDLLNYRAVLQAERSAASEPRLALYEDVQVVTTSPLESRPYPVDVESAVGRALSDRADLIQAELELRSADIEVDRRKNQLLPKLNVTGSWTQSGLDENLHESVDSLGSGRFYDWSVGVAFEYPWGNRRERGLLAQSKRDRESRRIEVERLRNSIVLEVTRAARSIEAAYQKVQTTVAARRLRQEQLRGEQERLRVGSSTSYQVLQIQNDLLESSTEEVRARVEYQRAITAFESATGRVVLPRPAEPAPQP